MFLSDCCNVSDRQPQVSIYSEMEVRIPGFESQLMHLPALSAVLDKALLSECQSFHIESRVGIVLNA